MDSQHRAQELASMLLCSSSPPQISAACSAIETFLQKYTTDQTRSFYSIAFPVLICKIFGFEESLQKSLSVCGWIDQIHSSNDSELAGRVFNLLSPSGPLISSIHAIDRYLLVKYVFPIERLPEWARFLLQSDRNCCVLSDLCPLFKDRINEDSIKGSYQVQLNVFEYYMFWFAYYPVCKGKGEYSESKEVRKSRRFGLDKWTSLPGFPGSGRGSVQKTECNMYTRLLYAYLRAFVPKYGLSTYQPYRSSLLHYSTSEDGSIALQAEFLVHTLIQFWLVDNDFSILPVNVCRSLGVSIPFRAILDQAPPSAGLGEVVKIFVTYLNSSLTAEGEGYNPVSYNGSPRCSVSGSVVKFRTTISSFSYAYSAGFWNSLVQRPLYRFISRTFLFCPIGTSMKNAVQVFQLWTVYLEPWKISSEEFAEYSAPRDQFKASEVENLRNQSCIRNFPKENILFQMKKDAGNEKCQSDCSYTPCWQAYVVSNYLFYSSMLVHFLGFAHRFLHVNAETVIQMTLKVLSILTSSNELMDILKKVDAAYHCKPAGSSSPKFDSSYKFVPSIREQLLDWEDGLSRSERDGDALYLRESCSPDLKLFSATEDGGHQLLQLLILRAEPEIQALSGDKLAHNLQTLHSLKAKMKSLFGPSELPSLVIPEQAHTPHGRDDVFTPKHPGVGDIKYKGDWMKRPITYDEVAWFARILVRLSDWLNQNLGLVPLEDGSCGSRIFGRAGSAWYYLDVPRDDVVCVRGLRDAALMVWRVVVALVSWVGQGVVRFMREHGLRINLRVLASKNVMFLLVCSVVGVCGFYFHFPAAAILAGSDLVRKWSSW